MIQYYRIYKEHGFVSEIALEHYTIPPGKTRVFPGETSRGVFVDRARTVFKRTTVLVASLRVRVCVFWFVLGFSLEMQLVYERVVFNDSKRKETNVRLKYS